MQRTGGSRFAQKQTDRHRRLAPVADLPVGPKRYTEPMRTRKTIKAVGVALALTLVVALVLRPVPPERVNIRCRLSLPPDQVQPVYVEVQCGTAKRGLAAPWGMYLRDTLESALRETQLSSSLDQSEAKTVLRCSYSYGFCMPYLGRHLEPHWSAIKRAEIVLLDRQHKVVLAQALFQRPLLAQRPQDSLFQSLLHDMLSKGPEVRPNQQGGANGRQPFGSDTNRTSAADASRRSP